MVDTLPYHIWLDVLRLVPFGDRVKNVQFVNKYFQALCLDRSLLRNMDFSKAVLLPDDVCLELICDTKEFILTLSFKNCHWFTNDLFMNLPRLKCLKSLDLLGCFRSGACLHHIVKCAPSLVELAFTITGEELRIFFKRCEENAEEMLNLRLERLHIECHPGMYIHTDFTADITRFLVSQGRRPKSFSMNWVTQSESIVKLFTIPSEHTMDYDCTVHLINAAMHRAFCTALSFANLHHSSKLSANGVPSSLPRYDLTKIRFLSLPRVFPLSSRLHVTCSGADCPKVLPNLQCLSLPLASEGEETASRCYQDLIRDLLFSSSYPNLRCLKVTGHHLQVPLQLYTRIAELKCLEELHLTHLQVNLCTLLESLKGLKSLHTISVFPGAEAESTLTERFSSNSIYHDLPNLFFNMKKLEITQPQIVLNTGHRGCLKILEQLHCFPKLEKLSLRQVQFPAQFSGVLSMCVNVTSINFSYLRSANSFDYATLINEGLSKMPHLSELYITDELIEYSQFLFESVSKCRNLEKIVVFGLKIVLFSERTAESYDNAISPSSICRFVQPVLDNCHRLYAFFLVIDATDSWCLKMDAGKQELRYNPRLILKFLPKQSNQSLFRWLQFDTSFVFDYNAYNFPYSNVE